jgi:biopolymer transport protein ExbB
MQTFRALDASGGAANPLAATAGIGEALITTAAGLVAALILLFPYNLLDSRVEE